MLLRPDDPIDMLLKFIVNLAAIIALIAGIYYIYAYYTIIQKENYIQNELYANEEVYIGRLDHQTFRIIHDNKKEVLVIKKIDKNTYEGKVIGNE